MDDEHFATFGSIFPEIFEGNYTYHAISSLNVSVHTPKNETFSYRAECCDQTKRIMIPYVT